VIHNRESSDGAATVRKRGGTIMYLEGTEVRVRVCQGLGNFGTPVPLSGTPKKVLGENF
jgi:hypothetical protein